MCYNLFINFCVYLILFALNILFLSHMIFFFFFRDSSNNSLRTFSIIVWILGIILNNEALLILWSVYYDQIHCQVSTKFCVENCVNHYQRSINFLVKIESHYVCLIFNITIYIISIKLFYNNISFRRK